MNCPCKRKNCPRYEDCGACRAYHRGHPYPPACEAPAGKGKRVALDKRLGLLAEEMTPGGFGVDVGTDHGYLAAALVQRGRARGMLATDVNPRPLQSAADCIREQGLEDRIETRLADGLSGLDLEPVTDIFIAGMGGILISEILAARHPLAGKKLVLQPMTQAPALRRWLLSQGYEIQRERCALQGGKAYTVITARYGGTPRECSPLFALVGRTPEDPSPDAGAYLHGQLARLRRKLAGLGMAKEQAGAAECAALAAELEEILKARKEQGYDPV